MRSIVLSFDIGIKNLAYCCLEQKESGSQILGWENVNLLDSPETQVEKAKCSYCKSAPKFLAGPKPVCGRHVPPLLPLIKDASGNLFKALPKLATLKEILSTKHDTKVALRKDLIMEQIAKHYSIPIVKVKKPNANHASLDVIHDAIRALVLKYKEQWQTCTLICLENQPAFKNPHMKSVQTLLYATLRDILQPSPPPIQLVHAGKKVKGATTGDEGYKERKAGSEDRAAKFLKTPLFVSSPWKVFYEASKKKSDLADALCMSIDHLAVSSTDA